MSHHNERVYRSTPFYERLFEEDRIRVKAIHQAKPSRSELRAHLQQILPDYMIPSAFVWLDALPKTTNGKVDRNGLPAPARTRPEPDQSFESPATPIEKQVASLCEKVLGVEPVGRHDNFFDLGGDSLSAMQMLSRVRQQLELDIALPLFFGNPTVAGLARVIVQGLVDRETHDDLAQLLTELEGSA
jgi:acyl carrier protein